MLKQLFEVIYSACIISKITAQFRLSLLKSNVEFAATYANPSNKT